VGVTVAVTADTLRQARQLRANLNRTTASTTRQLVEAWVRAWDELAPEWQAAIADVFLDVADGQWPSVTRLARVERVWRALGITRTALDVLAREAGATITATIPTVVTSAADAQAGLIASQMPPQAVTADLVASLGTRVDRDALAAIVERTTGRIQAAAWPLAADAEEAMRRALVRGVAIGEHPRQAARRMLRLTETRFNGGLTRALVIARTEMLDAHRAGSLAAQRASSDVLAGWTWLATLDRRTCPSCWAMHGTVHPVDEPGPLDHQQGRCARLPKLRTWRELGFDVDEPPDLTPDAASRFAALPPADQLAVMGPTRLAALRDGTATLADMATRRTTSGWRDSYAPTPVRDLPRRPAAAAA
jgi:SPP1 gp7 family putative phage head morphogenesis protein